MGGVQPKLGLGPRMEGSGLCNIELGIANLGQELKKGNKNGRTK